MSSPYPWLRVAGLAGILVTASVDASAQRTRDAGPAAEDGPSDEEDGEDDVMYVDEEQTADGEESGPGSASLSGGGLGCGLAGAGARGTVGPLLLAGLLLARRRRR